ncbi:transcriptional regulator, AraC family [Pricia antarctica]|uniref:Transcriptional regulator, AraC family n=1 Tax=Pricia antarctica TaxID=641691 RepID=A0A1G7H975_9FLAO|nr:AraC family transcriptional regulator [Pricia antarctica]SDE97007.1 transcriptional regulator, AraC family [Pricia antarctica]
MTSEENRIHPEYLHRINKALAFIDQNLDTHLTLESVANIACYSPYHFHRLFKAITRETLNAYIARRSIEKAASILMHKKEVSVSELSLQYGFSSNSSFTRAFKNFYGVPPTEFRKKHVDRHSKIRQTESKNGQENHLFEKYICNIDNLIQWITMNSNIEIKETPELHLASITQIGVNGIEQAFERLIRWATPRGLMNSNEAKMARIFHDSFKVTGPDKVRMTIGLLTNAPFKTAGEIHKATIEKSKCIVGHFEIAPDGFEKAWSGLFIWMNENGYIKAEEHPFEIYQNDFREHPEGKAMVDMYIPIE